jgi:hypothetical protein
MFLAARMSGQGLAAAQESNKEQDRGGLRCARFLNRFALIFAASCFAQTIVIRGVTIVDVQQGQLIRDRNVTIVKDRIVSVTASSVPAPPSTHLQLVNGTGKFLMPGMWDMRATNLLADPAWYVTHGITGARDMSSADLEKVLALYLEIEAGQVVGPRILTGGPGIHASNPADARLAFDRLYDTDADFVRFHSDLDAESYIALAERTRKWRYPLVGPLPPSVRLRDAISLRQSSIEGITGLDRLNRDEACSGFSSATVAGVWFTPALSSQRRKNYRKAESLVRLMLECGGRVLAGGPLPDELEALVEAGFTAQQALQTATTEPARFLLNQDSLGSVSTGKFADIVLLDADPLEDVSNVRRIAGVFVRGRYYNGAALAALRRPPTIRAWPLTPQPPPPASTSAVPKPAASSAKPPASSAKPALPIR